MGETALREDVYVEAKEVRVVRLSEGRTFQMGAGSKCKGPEAETGEWNQEASAAGAEGHGEGNGR